MQVHRTAALPAPSRQTVLLILATACGLAMVAGWSVSHLPLTHVTPVLGALLFLLNLVCIGVFMIRAQRSRAERPGWLLLGIGGLLVMAAHGLSPVMSSDPLLSNRWDWAFLVLQCCAGSVQTAGLLVWPRSRDAVGSPVLHLLGSLIFASSLVLLMLLIGVWKGEHLALSPAYVRNIALALRLALFGGAVVYLAGMDSRRLNGPIGWFLGAAVVSAFVLLLMRPFLVSSGMPDRVSPWFGIALLAPVFLILGAWAGGSVLPGPGQRAPRVLFGEAAVYAPYLVSGGILAFLVMQRQDPLSLPFLAFVVITGLLVLRQFLLLRDLRAANQDLEDKVAARTGDLERLQGAMVRTERMNAVATIGAGLAHDLNNLLQAVGSYAELVQEQIECGRLPLAKDVSRIREATSKAGGLTQRLMAFARREQELIHRTSMSPVQAVLAQEEMLRMLAGKQIHLEVASLPELPGVLADPGLLEQVLVNLVGNARDALQGRGTIHIRCRPGPVEDGRSRVILEVEDDGPGIPPALRERIFEPFFTTKPDGKGTGLGLPSVRALVESMGGRVDLVEGTLGGACFQIVIPETS